jgi:hypothetical protein
MKSFARALCAVAALACATALYAAEPVSIQQAARTGDVSAVYAFVADGVDINAADADGLTPLHWAADSAEAETAQQLLALGANANARDHAGRTPLHYAARAGQSSIVEQLFAHGASISAADVRGNTPLHLAASRARPAVAGLLIAAGADVNARNEAGQTPLHVVGDQTRPDVDDVELQAVVRDVAQVLMTAGADPAARDGDGNVAWPHAAPVSEPRQPSGYPTYDQIAATLLTKANTYPTLCQRFDLGTSSTTQHLYALKLTSNVGVEADKPEFNWVSTMHGDEVTGVVLCLNMIDYLLANYGSISRVTNLVDNVEIWFVPCMNPYGYANNTRYNANGADLNRSFPEGSGSSPDPNTPTGRQPEVATIMNWGYAHSFTLGANYHGGSLVCNYPYDNDNLGSVFSPTPDEDLFQYISLQYSSHNLPMYNSTSFTHGITNGAAWYAITGGMQDWNYRYVGANHVTIEVSETKSPAYSQMPTFWSQNQESMLSYMETCLIGVRGIVTDATTGAPLAATVTVAGRNHPIYTDPDVGDYHRMLLPGTYQLTFAAAGHETRTLPATVVSGPATRLDVVLGGPPRITAPNGGESLTAGAPTNVTWTGAPTTQFQVQQSSNYGQTGPTTDGFESGTLGSAYTSGGNAPWFVTTGSPHAGTYSARAGAITHSQTTWMTCTAQAGPISFWHKVSSEGGYDWFNFYIDGAQILHKSGTVSWTQYTTTLAAGTHTLKWEYTKDAGVSGGADTVWIDDLTLTGDATTWTDIIALTPVGAASTAWTPTTVSSTNKVRARTYFGGSSYSSWDESDATFSVVAAPQGACCATNGSCAVTTQALCTGTYQGDGTTCTPNPCPPAGCAGDMNCNGSITFADIDLFVEALGGESAWTHTCPWINADCNGDHNVTFADIDPFVGLIGTTCP